MSLGEQISHSDLFSVLAKAVPPMRDQPHRSLRPHLRRRLPARLLVEVVVAHS
jgi:hypothetical protein